MDITPCTSDYICLLTSSFFSPRGRQRITWTFNMMLAEAIDSTFHTNKHKQFLMHNIISVLLFLPKSVTYKPQGGQPDHHLSAK